MDEREELEKLKRRNHEQLVCFVLGCLCGMLGWLVIAALLVLAPR